MIEFHEIPRNLPYSDELFMNLARKNGVPEEQMLKVRKMSEVLKDADALDRTRFITKARLNPDYLEYDVSKKLIKFASSLQETYALEDLKEFQCEDAVSVLLEGYTPQEVLRNIRHSTRGTTKLEDIQEFAYSWAAASVEKTDELQNMLDDNNISNREGTKHGKK